MADKQSCPSSQALGELLMGRVPEPEASRLSEHLEHCPRCAETVRGLEVTDSVLEAIKEIKGAGRDAGDSFVPVLVQRLKESRPGGDASTQDVAQGTHGDQAGVGGDTTQEFLTFLAPPEGPGELGRLGG